MIEIAAKFGKKRETTKFYGIKGKVTALVIPIVGYFDDKIAVVSFFFFTFAPSNKEKETRVR